MYQLKSCVPFLICLLSSTIAIAQTPKSIKTIIVDAGHGGKDFGAHGGYEGGLGTYEKNVTLAISNKLVAELKKQLPDVKVVPTRTTDIYQSPPEKANIANDNKGDLFLCIHADAANLQTGKRQVGTRQETRHKITYTGKGKRRKKFSTPYTVTVPVYEYYKIGTKRSGTSIWIFAPHKTSDKLRAAMKGSEDEYNVETSDDSTYSQVDFSQPEYRMMAKINAERYQKKAIRLGNLIDEEIDKSDRSALGLNQRQVGIWVLQATNMPAILVETGFITNYEDERYLNSEKGQQELAECITRAVKKYKEQLENPKPESTPQAVSTEEKKVLKEATSPK